MKIINVYGKSYTAPSRNIREMSRGIIMRDGKILLVHENKTGKWLTPGGRVEPGETLKNACLREVREETGFVVEARTEKPFLSVREYYENNTFITNYFLCDAVGTCESMPTPYELEVENTAEWVDVNDAVNLFSDHAEYKCTDEFKHGHHLREYNAISFCVVK